MVNVASSRFGGSLMPGRRWPDAMTAAVAVVAVIGGVSCAGQPAASMSASQSAPVPSRPAPAASTEISAAPSSSSASSPHVTAMPSAPASGIVLHLIAQANRWNVSTLEAPAGKTFQLELDNRDQSPQEFHNFAVLDGPNVENRIYQSPKSNGPIVSVFDVPGLPAGTYTFSCTVHPLFMEGVLTVRTE
jgi:plastocyanin